MVGGCKLTDHVVDDDEKVFFRVVELVVLGAASVPAPDGADTRVESCGEAARGGDHGVEAGSVGVERPAQLRPGLDHEAEVVGVCSAGLQFRCGGPPFPAKLQRIGLYLGWADGELGRVLGLPFTEEIQTAREEARGPEIDVRVDVFARLRLCVFRKP